MNNYIYYIVECRCKGRCRQSRNSKLLSLTIEDSQRWTIHFQGLISGSVENIVNVFHRLHVYIALQLLHIIYSRSYIHTWCVFWPALGCLSVVYSYRLLGASLHTLISYHDKNRATNFINKYVLGYFSSHFKNVHFS